MTHAAITGWGKCLPPAILTNADLATFLPTDDEWITTRTGMKERRISHVPGIELAIVAAQRAIACAGLTGADIDLVIYGSCSNDETVPNSASAVQQRIGAIRAAAFDVNTACTSFMYGLSVGTSMRNSMAVLDWPGETLEVTFLTPVMPATASSMTLVTWVSISAGAAPGWLADTRTKGTSMLGKRVMGRALKL